MLVLLHFRTPPPAPALAPSAAAPPHTPTSRSGCRPALPDARRARPAPVYPARPAARTGGRSPSSERRACTAAPRSGPRRSAASSSVFAARFETALTQLNDGLARPRAHKRLGQVRQRIGRLKAERARGDGRRGICTGLPRRCVGGSSIRPHRDGHVAVEPPTRPHPRRARAGRPGLVRQGHQPRAGAGWPGDAGLTVSSTVTRNGNRLDLPDLHANQFPVVPPIVVDADRDHLLLVVGGRHGARLALLSG